ncbi:MAG: hypothetical protein KIT69_06680, partial [Propionibacteriaceae bacterium]|nr:hypothetical protein [Propionibacteriaceae bacterium]
TSEKTKKNSFSEQKYILQNDIQTYIPLLTKKCNINTIIAKSNLNISDKDKQILQNNLPIKLFVHSSYMSYAWCSPKLYKKIMTFIKNQYIISCYINALGLIIHMPTLNKYKLYKNKPYNDLLKIQNQYGNMFVKNKNSQHIKCKILFETNSCLPKNSLYYNNISILNKFKNIVLDTSHIWSCGIDISSNILAKNFLNELNPNNIKLIHFNDNYYDLGSGKDEHNNLFKGKIWSKYKPKITSTNIDNYRLQTESRNLQNNNRLRG